MENAIDLRDILHILKQKLLFIILITLFAAATGAVLSIYIIDPIYESSATMIVNKSNAGERQDTTYNDILLTQRLVKTYSVIMQSNTVLNRVIDVMRLNMEPEELRKMLTISGVNDTEVIRIKVTSENPKFAADLANEITRQAPTEIIRAVKAGSVEVIDAAAIPSKPIKPNKKINTAISGILGLMFSIFFVFLKDYFDDTIKSEEDIVERLNLPVLGALPFYRPEPVAAGRKGRK